ncbi:hypothetical protein GCM10010358_74400 [Streptomyces minutiscleroticus]|uniref:Uncharacterized protein n=1 Tax=Streptomyces minutiscleroticus TaxID=68238 RepID=A0A918U8Y5_9ACTN|nr:hypothetical protein GCM10010358_74400 [Streptomyces minutiscleroticus]
MCGARSRRRRTTDVGPRGLTAGEIAGRYDIWVMCPDVPGRWGRRALGRGSRERFRRRVTVRLPAPGTPIGMRRRRRGTRVRERG